MSFRNMRFEGSACSQVQAGRRIDLHVIALLLRARDVTVVAIQVERVLVPRRGSHANAHRQHVVLDPVRELRLVHAAFAVGAVSCRVFLPAEGHRWSTVGPQRVHLLRLVDDFRRPSQPISVADVHDRVRHTPLLLLCTQKPGQIMRLGITSTVRQADVTGDTVGDKTQ